MSTTQSAPSGPVRVITGRHQRSSLPRNSLPLLSLGPPAFEADSVVLDHTVMNDIVERLARE